MTSTTTVSLNVDPFQASRALYNELEALMADEKTLQLPHDELEDLLMKEYAKLDKQLYLDSLNLVAMSDESQTEQATNVCVDERQGEEPFIGPNLDLPFTGPPSQDNGLDDGVLTTECKGIVMPTDALRLTTAQAADQLSEPLTPLIGLFGCGKLILIGGSAASIDIQIPHIPQNILSLDANIAGQHKTRPDGCKSFIVISGVPTIAPQFTTESRSPARALELLCRTRAVFRKVHATNDIIPRAA